MFSHRAEGPQNTGAISWFVEGQGETHLVLCCCNGSLVLPKIKMRLNMNCLATLFFPCKP